MGIWNHTDVPLACLISFRTYGTWLAGDERGSIDRYHNQYGAPFAESNIIREQQQVAKLRSEPFVMNARSRHAVREAIEEVCRYRGWALYAANVRTNHSHSVIAGPDPDKILGDLKRYSTRRLRAAGLWKHEHSPWSDKGSKRMLWNENHISSAVDYVLFGQGRDLPEFD
jgi:REP element-mobilizing transposase RayT